VAEIKTLWRKSAMAVKKAGVAERSMAEGKFSALRRSMAVPLRSTTACGGIRRGDLHPHVNY